MSRQVAVIGGGISGLTCAYRLLKESPEPLGLTLYEASDRLGGVITTDVSQGVVLEGGPDSFLRRKPQALDLIQELGMEDQVLGTNPQIRGAYIFHQGHFHDIPPGVGAGIPTRLDTLWGTELLSLGEKLPLFFNRVRPRRTPVRDVPLGPLLRHRFGNGYVDRIAAPMMAGIYAGDIDQLSTAATAPGLLVRPRRTRRTPKIPEVRPASDSAPRLSMFATLKGGMETLVQALTARVMALPARVVLNTPIVQVTTSADGFAVTTAGGSVAFFSDVVVAVPAYQAATLLAEFGSDVRQILSSIPYADLAVVGAVYAPEAVSRPLDRTGFLVPRGEGVEMTAGTWVHAKWAYPDAPAWVPVRGFYGRVGQQGLLSGGDDDLLSVFRREMGYIMGVTDAPHYSHVFRAPGAMPQYLVGHLTRIQTVRQALSRWPHLQVIGSYIDGVGVPDCIRHANDAAAQLIRQWTVQGTGDHRPNDNE